MKFSILAVVAAVMAPAVMAVQQPLKPVVVTYPNNTPDAVMNSAMEAIVRAGGVITHEFKTLIKGFSAKASAEALEVVSALNAEFNPYIEADSVVTASGDFATDDISKE